MLGLVLIYLLVWAVLVGLFWGGTVWLQGYVYSEPTSDLFWKAPLAASVITAFLVFWSYLDYRSPGRYQALFEFSPNDEVPYFKELWVVKDGNKIHYKLTKDTNGHSVYRDDRHRPLLSRVDAIIVKENDEEVRFDAERDKDGKLVTQTGNYLRYIDGRGRVMAEDSIGRLSIFRWGRFWANILLNLFQLVLWFACLWFLLQFQWSHALGLALVSWVIMTVIIVPLILNKVETVAKDRSAMTSPAPTSKIDYRLPLKLNSGYA